MAEAPLGSRQHDQPVNYTTAASSEGEHAPLLPNHAGASGISKQELPAVADAVPLSGWLIVLIEACERFAFFGLQGPLQNYMQLPSEGAIRHGGLGLGQKNATLVKLLFNIWCYIVPIFGGIVADQYLGRFRTILYSSCIYIFGLAVLVGSSMLIHTAGSLVPVIGLFVSMVAIGLGTGGIKVNVNPLLAEQYTSPENPEIQLNDGQMARIDYDATIQRMFLLFYMFINFGSLSVLVMGEIEQKFGFAWTYALALVVFVTGTIILLTTKKLYKQSAPSGAVLIHVFQVLGIALKSGLNLDSARPENRLGQPRWDSQLVDDVSQTLYACRVFLFFPFYWCAYSQILTTLISQAGTMDTGSIPNDVLVSANTLTVFILVPIFDRIIYPFCHRRSINVGPLQRLAAGFFICALAMGYAALLQRQIYSSPPCYDHPLAVTCGGGLVPNDVSVLLQIPVHVLIALSEVLFAATGIEFAYASAPKSMKSLVMSLYLLTNAAGMGLAIGFGRLADDPWMVVFYDSLTLEVFVAGCVFCYVYRHTILAGNARVLVNTRVD